MNIIETYTVCLIKMFLKHFFLTSKAWTEISVNYQSVQFGCASKNAPQKVDHWHLQAQFSSLVYNGT